MQAIRKLAQSPLTTIVPALAILLIVFGAPTVQLFLESMNAPNFSLQNYYLFFGQYANFRVLLQTLEISAVATFICLVVGYPTAYLISTASKRARVILIVLVVIPYLTSGLARTYSWIVILGDTGLINSVLMDHGFISSPFPLIYNRSAVYVGMVHIMLPMMILPIVSVMMGIDTSLIAAAKSMGARPSTAFWRVYFPLSIPGVRGGTLLVFVICLGFYITPAALGGLGDAMLSTFIASQVSTGYDMGSISASSFILLAITLMLLSVFGLNLSGGQDAAPKPPKVSYQRLAILRLIRSYFNEISVSSRAKRWPIELYRARMNAGWSRISARVILALVMFFLLFPELVVIIMSFSEGATLQFPPTGLSLQWYTSFFNNEAWYGAAWTSVKIGLAVAGVSTVVGTLAAYGLSRVGFGLRSFITMIILTPITIPVIVVGVASYFGLANLGLIGTETGVILAHTIGGISYVVVIVAATLANFDTRLEQAAKSMGARPFTAFIRVTLPLSRPGLVAGALFAFIHSFDEVVTTSLVSGYSVRTLPLKMWENIRNEIDPTVAAVASLLTLLPIIWMIALYIAWWRERARSQVVMLEGVA
ncbi:ABC transporter permease subunit [Sinorhizobium meliloti]|uniref:ABC transporter permease subunit n=1 Tax=Rhizobium meliloti TaxID=382 RepID=UPI000FD47A72|nr:ABC transporter permease subunit [Sinorhizobium meliloti]RVE81819.1 ABC transporter permease subunit [Sinorhizobium meliloti]RVG00035.1 ABC transporter permease subunit [Sinorhizobium meliloti]RVM94281.1 ABC transporter permease subunit [Sinorhizobium meliloti]